MKAKEIYLSKGWEIFLKIIIAFSIPCVTLFVSFNIFNYSHAFSILCFSLFLSFFLGIFLLRKVNLSHLKINDVILSLFLGLYAGKYVAQFGRVVLDTFLIRSLKIIHLSLSSVDLVKFMRFTIIPACIFYAYLFLKYLIPKVLLFFKSLTKVEKIFLRVVMICGGIIVLLLAFNTNMFYRPTYDNQIVNGDVMYTSDSGVLVYYDAFTNFRMEENDIRQPLFGLCAYPFGLLARFISQFLFFLPSYSYELTMVFIQIVLVAITLIMLARIIKLEEKNKIYFYLLFLFSFSYFIFSIVVEQYVIGLFYLTLTLYLYFTSKKINYAFIGATGTLLTSGVLFPLVTKFKNCKQWIKDLLWCAVIFFVVMTLSGQLVQVPYIGQTLKRLSRFTGDISFIEKMYQFTHFVKGIFIAPLGEIVFFEDIPRYHLQTFTNYSVVGIILLVVLFISFLLNRKDKCSVIAFLWVLFSFIILVLVGWGTAENGLILYSLYFAWAYILLIYKFIRYLIKDQRKANGFILFLVVFLILCNLPEMYRILKFALTYYSMW